MPKQSKAGHAYIGTSGWSYTEWQDIFYPEDCSAEDYLSFYAQQFNTVELNNTFYHLPAVQSVKHWAQTVPKAFVFTVKGSRYITHMKKLHVDAASIHKFFDVIEPLERHLGPILFQLPAHFKAAPERLQEFIHQLPTGYRYAFEFRDTSWFEPEIIQLLTQENMGFCIYDFSGTQAPTVITADFTYLRFHGPRKQPYVGAYTHSFLNQWAKRIQQWLQGGLDVYCYFDNTADGAAIQNAKQLIELLTPSHKRKANIR